MSEQVERLRRIAERGLSEARLASRHPECDLLDASESARYGYTSASVRHLDLWQHMLDEIGRLPKDES